ncbi:MAG: YybS family protein [Veillonellaceae bacterium]|nr:YybS family protein [Veillonellaceae bacterium]
MSNSRVKPMVEGGILSAVAILFALISVYIPLIGAFVNMIWPVPIILLGVRHGYKWSLMATVVAGILIAILLHPLHAVGVAIGFGLTGIALGQCFRRNLSPVHSVLIGSVASLASKLIVLAISAAVMGINPLADYTGAMSGAVDQAIDFYRSFGMKEDDLAKVAQNLRGMIDMMKLILPAGFVMASVVDTYLNFLVARAVLRKLGHQIGAFPAFSAWKFTPKALAAFIISMVLIYWGKSQNIELAANAGLNLQVVSSLLFVIQGISVASFFAAKHDVPRFILWIGGIMAITNGFIMQAFVFVGAFDIVFDFRKLRQPLSREKSDSGEE